MIRKRRKLCPPTAPLSGDIQYAANITMSYVINVDPLGGFRLSVLMQYGNQKLKHIIFQADSDRATPAELYKVLHDFTNGHISVCYINLKKDKYAKKEASIAQKALDKNPKLRRLSIG